MAITSFKHFLNADKPKPSDFIRFFQLLFQGLSLHAVEGDVEGLARFRSEMDRLAQTVTGQSSSEELLVAVGSIVQLLQLHNQSASRFMRAYAKEMQTMLGMMSGTIAFLATSNKTGVAQLQSIEQHLETAVDLDDVKLFREKLSECLTAVRNESVRIQGESCERIQVLQKGVARTAKNLPPIPPLNDPATGLQVRSQAEDAIARCILDGQDTLLALFLVDRLSSLNSRYGRKIGDEVLLMVALHLTQNLPENSPPFRWSGPAFMALIDMTEENSMPERRLRQIANERLEKHIDDDGRSLLLPVSCSMVVQRIDTADAPDVVFRALDKFIAAHGGEGR